MRNDALRHGTSQRTNVDRPTSRGNNCPFSGRKCPGFSERGRPKSFEQGPRKEAIRSSLPASEHSAPTPPPTRPVLADECRSSATISPASRASYLEASRSAARIKPCRSIARCTSCAASARWHRRAMLSWPRMFADNCAGPRLPPFPPRVLPDAIGLACDGRQLCVNAEFVRCFGRFEQQSRRLKIASLGALASFAAIEAENGWARKRVASNNTLATSLRSIEHSQHSALACAQRQRSTAEARSACLRTLGGYRGVRTQGVCRVCSRVRRGVCSRVRTLALRVRRGVCRVT